MAAYNFGMLTAGLPDLAQRQVSQPILGNDYYQSQQNDWLADWQGKFDASPARYVQTGGGTWGGADVGALQAAINASSGKTGWMADPDGSYSQSLVSAAQNGNASSQGIIGAFGGSYGTYAPVTGYFDNSARDALTAEKASHQATYDAMMKTRQANQQAQQSAYDQSNGGGFSGGIINASYGTPFGGALAAPTMAAPDGVAMPQNQPWGQAGYGGPTGGASQGGFGGGWGQNAQSSQPQGWGGPFTNKNPWAAS